MYLFQLFGIAAVAVDECIVIVVDGGVEEGREGKAVAVQVVALAVLLEATGGEGGGRGSGGGGGAGAGADAQ